MKKIGIAVTVAFAIVGALTSIGLSQTDLVAYYSFDDGTAIDLSGNGYDGILRGPVPAPGPAEEDWSSLVIRDMSISRHLTSRWLRIPEALLYGSM